MIQNPNLVGPRTSTRPAGSQDITNLHGAKSAHLFRATFRIERGWLIKSFNWVGILDIESGVIHLRILRARAHSVRTILESMFSGILWILVLLSVWRPLNSYFSATLPDGDVLIWAVSGFILFFVFWFLGTVGTIYLVDFLTLGIQIRYSGEAWILALKDVRMGRFRHVLRVVVQKDVFPSNTEGTEFLLTVLGTRKRLANALDLNRHA